MGRATIGRMTDAEFLRRIDQHIAVANEHMARGNEHTARGNELWAEARQGYADLHGSIDDLRVELRQTGLRGQRVAEWFAAEVRESRLEREADRLEREADRREREADRRGRPRRPARARRGEPRAAFGAAGHPRRDPRRRRARRRRRLTDLRVAALAPALAGVDERRV